jgi:hypothetical protein
MAWSGIGAAAGIATNDVSIDIGDIIKTGVKEAASGRHVMLLMRRRQGDAS